MDVGVVQLRLGAAEHGERVNGEGERLVVRRIEGELLGLCGEQRQEGGEAVADMLQEQSLLLREGRLARGAGAPRRLHQSQQSRLPLERQEKGVEGLTATVKEERRANSTREKQLESTLLRSASTATPLCAYASCQHDTRTICTYSRLFWTRNSDTPASWSSSCSALQNRSVCRSGSPLVKSPSMMRWMR